MYIKYIYIYGLILNKTFFQKNWEITELDSFKEKKKRKMQNFSIGALRVNSMSNLKRLFFLTNYSDLFPYIPRRNTYMISIVTLFIK